MEIKTSVISFCNKKALNVVSDKFKSFLLSNLREQYDISITDRNAHILNHKSIRNLSNPHLISLKTIGNNYYLFLTKINGEDHCFFIDKKIKNGYTYPRVVLIKYNFNKKFYNDTILEGELVRDNQNNWTFLIFDIRCFMGVNQKNINVVNKITNIYSILSDFKVDVDNDICNIQVKRFFNYNEFDYMMNEFIPNLNYKISGLFFNTMNPRHHNYLHFFPRQQKRRQSNLTSTLKEMNISTTNRISGKKDYSRHSVQTYNNTNQVANQVTRVTQNSSDTKVFIIKKTDKPDVYHLYCLKGNDLIKYGVACMPTLKLSRFIRSVFIKSSKTQDIKMVCLYNSKFKKWQPESLIDVYSPDDYNAIKDIEKKHTIEI